MINSTTRDRKPKQFSQQHLAGIKAAARLRRQSAQGETEIIFERSCQPGFHERPETRIKNFLNQLNADIIWAKHKQRQILDAEFLAGKLQKKLEVDFSGVRSELVKFLSEYIQNILEVEEKYKYPIGVETLSIGTYGNRFDALEKFKKDGFKKLDEFFRSVK